MDLFLLIARSLLTPELSPVVAMTTITLAALAVVGGVAGLALYVILQISQKGRGR